MEFRFSAFNQKGFLSITTKVIGVVFIDKF